MKSRFSPAVSSRTTTASPRRSSASRAAAATSSARGGGLRGGVRALPRRAALRGRRERDRRADDRLRALGVGPGDEVVMPSFTFYATAEAALVLGARAGLLRHRPRTPSASPAETVEAALTPRTKAIVPVDLFGNVAPIPELRELGVPGGGGRRAGRRRGPGRREGRRARRRGHLLVLPVEEPALPGRRRGDRDRRRRAGRADARILRFHGSKDKTTFTDVGCNSRLDELQAAVLRMLLPELDGWIERRREVAPPYERLGPGRARDAAAGHRGRAARLSPLRGALGARAADRARLLPHARAPPAGDRRDAPSCPAPRRPRARTSPCPMGTDLSEDQVRQVVERVAAAT